MKLLIALMVAVAQEEDPRPKDLREMEGLRQEVEMLRTLNDLKITKEQTDKLLALVETARRKINDAVKEASGDIEAVTKSLQKQRDAILKGEALDEEGLREFHEAQGRVGEVYRAMEEATRELSGSAKGVFEPAQLEEITWLRRHDPVGQVRNWARRMLPMMRKMPDEAFENNGGDPIRGFIERFPGVSEDDREAEVDRILKVVSEARTLLDEEFEKQQGELVKKIVGEGKVGELAKKIKPPREPENELGRFLLQPRLEKVLRARK